MKIFRPHISKAPEKAESSSDPHRYIPKKYRQFAADMEQQFAKHMIEQMNKSGEGFKSNDPGARYYRDLLQEEHAKTLTKSSGGLGIQEMILNDIYPKKFRNEAALKAYQNSQISNKKSHKVSQMGPKQNVEIKKYHEHTVRLGVPNHIGEHDE